MAESYTTTSTMAPWAGQQPYLESLFSRADSLYNQGPYQYYPNQQIADFGNYTQQGANMLSGLAQDSTFANNAQNLFGNLANASAFQNLTNTSGTGVPGYANAALQNLAQRGAGGLNQQGMNTLSALQNPNAYGINGVSQNALSQTASGQMLNANPYLDKMYGQASENLTKQFQNAVMPGINSAAESAGRYGSGMQALMAGEAQRNLGNSLGNLATNIYGQNYATERQNQMQAAQNLGNLTLQGQQLGAQSRGNAAQAALGAQQANQNANVDAIQNAAMYAGQLGNQARGQNLDARLSGAQNAAQFGNQTYGQNLNAQVGALSQANMLNQLPYFGANAMLNLGNMYDQQAQRQIDADMTRFAFEQQAPFDALARYGSLIQGNYGGAGSSTQPMFDSGSGSMWGNLASALGLGSQVYDTSFNPN